MQPAYNDAQVLAEDDDAPAAALLAAVVERARADAARDAQARAWLDELLAHARTSRRAQGRRTARGSAAATL